VKEDSLDSFMVVAEYWILSVIVLCGEFDLLFIALIDFVDGNGAREGAARENRRSARELPTIP